MDKIQIYKERKQIQQNIEAADFWFAQNKKIKEKSFIGHRKIVFAKSMVNVKDLHYDRNCSYQKEFSDFHNSTSFDSMKSNIKFDIIFR